MMESVLLVDRLKQAIQDDFKGMREKLDKTNQEIKHLSEENDILNKLNKELKEDNVSLTKALKELKEKFDHLHGKLKRKQDEIKKKDQWWDRYRFTAETMIKKLRTEGSFSPEVLHEVSRDLVDIMEEPPSKESNSSHSSQENEMKSFCKLATSKDRKKRVRYTEVSNHKGRVQAKELITKTNNEEKVNVEDESGISKHTDRGPAAYPKEHAGDRIQTTARKMEKEKKNLILGSEKQVTADRTGGRNKENDEGKYDLVATGVMKKDDEEHGMDLDDDETCARYPLLTSTPMFSASNAKSLLSSIASHDLSIIPKDKENVRSPSETNDVSGTGVNHDKGDNYSSPLTPAVPTIFENLLIRRSSLSSNSNSTDKNKNCENFPLKDETTAHFKKDRKLHGSKDMKIEQLNPTDKNHGSSRRILRNFELGTGAVMDDDTIDYPVASEDNLGSPSILALDLIPAGEEKCADFNAMKRKRGSSEEQMGIPLADQEAEILAQPCKKPSRKNRINSVKMPLKPPLSTSTNKQPKQAPISPESCSILLLSDEEGIKMESSSIDMFANSEKSISKDLSNDKDVIEGKGQSSKTAIPCTSQLSKDQDPLKQIQIENDLLDEEFPGFRKPEELSYKNIEVVRKKGERAKLNGFSCRECEQYYGEMTEEERRKKLKHCSRHRAKYSPPPSTPPGFWNLSFPSTQEVIEAGMMVTGDQIPVQKPLRRSRKKRLLKPIPKQM